MLNIMKSMKLLVLPFVFNAVAAIMESTAFRQKRSDDPSTAALEAVVQRQGELIQQQGTLIQQQAAQIQTLQAKLTALEGRLPSPSTPVAFTVRFSSDETNNGIALGPQQVLDFDSVVTNVGNGYNTHTGIFTAPVAGLYVFFLSIMSTNEHDGLIAAVVKDGSILDLVYAEGMTDKQDQGSTQLSTHLQLGQQVWVRQHTGDAVRGYWWTVFTGYLIQAD